jgi:large subunit ribosomal protein L25
MAETVALTAKKRSERGSGHARQLRRDGHIPAVVYGHKEEVVSLTVEAEDMARIVRHGQRVVDLKIGDGKTETCFIREVQWDAIGKDIIHVDFTRVSRDERIRVTVPVVLRGTSPGQTAGGILDQPMHTLDIECLALAVPEAIRVNIADLQLEKAIHLKEIALPEGVKAFGDPEAVVVQCVKPVEEAAAPAAEAAVAAGPAEPEVIGRKAAPEEAEAAEAPAKK